MMVEGIMVYTFDVWKIWIGQEDYVAYQGMPIEINLHNHYLKFIIGKDYDDWFVEFKEDVTFNLRKFDVYKVRVESIELMTEEDAF